MPSPSPSPATTTPTHAATSVVLAQFDDLLAQGLHQLIESDPSLQIVAEGVEQRRISTVLRAHRPNVVILDVGALDSLAEVRELTERHPATRLVLLASELSSVDSSQMLAFGASACLAPNTQSRDVLNAIHLASRGMQLIPHQASTSGEPFTGGQLLTRREAEVLPLLRQGRSNPQIALILQVGVETIRSHARNIYRKLGVSSRRDLATPPARAHDHDHRVGGRRNAVPGHWSSRSPTGRT